MRLVLVNRLLNNKSLFFLVVLLGVFSFSVCHASVMAHDMDAMGCHAQKLCGACPAPLISTPPAPDNPSILFDGFSEKPSYLPDPMLDPFYHPPR